MTLTQSKVKVKVVASEFAKIALFKVYLLRQSASEHEVDG